MKRLVLSISIMLMLLVSPAFSMQNSVSLAKYASARTVQISSGHGTGSGCIIASDGLILTNYHVAGDKKDLFVILPDGQVKRAKLISKGDNVADVALIKIEVDKLPYFEFGDSDNLSQGQEVMAIGFPFGLGKFTTFGHITALNITEGNSFNQAFYIMTDAAINPGNSGGGLIDEWGNLMGINTAIRPNGNNTGYALPINDVRRWIEQLKDHKKITYVMLGVTIGRIGMGDNENLEVPDNMVGVVVEKVEKGSPAYKAGIKRDDIILDIGGTKATDPSAIKSYIYRKNPGDVIHVSVYRDGKYLIKDVTLVAVENKSADPDDPATPEAPEDPTNGGAK